MLLCFFTYFYLWNWQHTGIQDVFILPMWNYCCCCCAGQHELYSIYIEINIRHTLHSLFFSLRSFLTVQTFPECVLSRISFTIFRRTIIILLFSCKSSNRVAASNTCCFFFFVSTSSSFIFCFVVVIVVVAPPSCSIFYCWNWSCRELTAAQNEFEQIFWIDQSCEKCQCLIL